MTKGLMFISATAITLAFAITATAASPSKTVISFDDPILEAEIAVDLTAACRAPIAADLSGKVEIIVLDKSNVVVAITGRSLTGSGVIGRVVVDLDTGEVLSVAGLAKGDFVENLCSELT
jgi:hypothetical protein